MNYIGITEDKEKLLVLLIWRGPEIVDINRTENPHFNFNNNNTKEANNDGDTTYAQYVDRETAQLCLSKMMKGTSQHIK